MNKYNSIRVLDIKFYKFDEDGNEMTNKDGTIKEFELKESVRFKPLEYLCEGLDVDMVREIKERKVKWLENKRSDY